VIDPPHEPIALPVIKGIELMRKRVEEFAGTWRIGSVARCLAMCDSVRGDGCHALTRFVLSLVFLLSDAASDSQFA
jgi:hypothetical protein